MGTDHFEDADEIAALITDLFEALSWDVDSPPDWDRFCAHFHNDARLFPSARPANSRSLTDFVSMMDSQYPDHMRSFSEYALHTKVHVFGNIATAIGAYSSEINGGEPKRGVNVYCFVREAGGWRIASMAWDVESDEQTVPNRFE